MNLKLLAILVVVAVLVIGATLFGSPSNRASEGGDRAALADLKANGPPAGMEGLAEVLTPIMPASGIAPGTYDAGQAKLCIPASETRRRALRVELAAGEGALLSFAALDPPAEGEPRPIRFCLARTGAPFAAQCDNRTIREAGALVSGPAGGCVTITPLGGGTARVTVRQ